MSVAGLTVILGTLLGVAQASPGLSLPEDERLASARVRLEQIIARTSAAGLPAELIVSKVREGLAKGVGAARIEAAAARLADGLVVAQKFIAERRPGEATAPPLVRALAEARLAGLELAAADAVVRSGRDPLETARAVEVLTDLGTRGYPSARASSVVNEVLARDPGALSRLPVALETIRRDQALTHVESVDALARGLAGATSLQAAYTRTIADERRRTGPGRGGGQPEDSSKKFPKVPGKSDVTPPGLEKRPPKARGPKK